MNQSLIEGQSPFVEKPSEKKPGMRNLLRLKLNCSKKLFCIACLLLLVFFCSTSKLGLLDGKATVGNLGLVTFGGPGLRKWIVEWHFAIISRGHFRAFTDKQYQLCSALLLNELSYKPGIGLILKG